MRKKVMAFNAKVNAWILKRLKGVWLDPIFCAIFAIMCVASIIGAMHHRRDASAQGYALLFRADLGVGHAAVPAPHPAHQKVRKRTNSKPKYGGEMI